MSRERAFNFSRTTKKKSLVRQGFVCAHCGKSLIYVQPDDDEEYPEDPDDFKSFAHHVVPDQSGNPFDPADSWMNELDNCVSLCKFCHPWVHQDGRNRDGAVAPPNFFRSEEH